MRLSEQSSGGTTGQAVKRRALQSGAPWCNSVRIGAWPLMQADAYGCNPLQVVAGGRFDLYSTYRVLVPAVLASISATA